MLSPFQFPLFSPGRGPSCRVKGRGPLLGRCRPRLHSFHSDRDRQTGTFLAAW